MSAIHIVGRHGSSHEFLQTKMKYEGLDLNQRHSVYKTDTLPLSYPRDNHGSELHRLTGRSTKFLCSYLGIVPRVIVHAAMIYNRQSQVGITPTSPKHFQCLHSSVTIPFQGTRWEVYLVHRMSLSTLLWLPKINYRREQVPLVQPPPWIPAWAG